MDTIWKWTQLPIYKGKPRYCWIWHTHPKQKKLERRRNCSNIQITSVGEENYPSMNTHPCIIITRYCCVVVMLKWLLDALALLLYSLFLLLLVTWWVTWWTYAWCWWDESKWWTEHNESKYVEWWGWQLIYISSSRKLLEISRHSSTLLWLVTMSGWSCASQNCDLGQMC